VKPGEEIKRIIKVELPRGLHDRSEWVRFSASSGGKDVAAPQSKTLVISSSKKPRLAYTVTVDDGNDGLPAKGETVQLRVAVSALDADASKVQLSLRNKSPGKIKMVKTRASRDQLVAGGVWSTTLSFEVRDASEPMELLLNLGIRDLGLWYTERLSLVPGSAGTKVMTCQGASVVATKDTPLRRAADANAPEVGVIKAGEALPCMDLSTHFYRLKLPNEGVVFMAQSAGKVGSGNAPKMGYSRTPPSISLLKSMKTEVDGTQLNFEAKASNDTALHNLVVYRGRKKILFAPGGPSNLSVRSAIELKPGQNLITVHAREGDEYGSSMSFWVLRRSGWDPDKKVVE
jgi:carboxyl-terminal processing protease